MAEAKWVSPLEDSSTGLNPAVEGLQVRESNGGFSIQYAYSPADGSIVACEWDRNGNTVARRDGSQTIQFECDFDDRLVRIVCPNGEEVRFGYDGLGRRVFWQKGSKSISQMKSKQ